MENVMENVDQIQALTLKVLEVSTLLFLFLLGLGLLMVIYMYLADVNQTAQAIRRNYPVVGRFRYFFEHLGEFFRQYFFALDRDELPFNRAQRSWVYRAAKNVDSTIAFGSTRPLNQPGDIIFLNCLFPTLAEDAVPVSEVSIGEGFAREPYTTNSLINISGMSFGAISVPAVRALSHGAARAGIWMNTGEGGLSPYHLEGGCDIVFQIGTAKYGVRTPEGELSDERLRELAAIEQVRMFEIKMSQGAKPGKGGILPGSKVTAEISAIRGIPEGKDSISPNGHTDIRCVENLLDRVAYIRELTGKPVGFKTVVGNTGWLDEMCSAILRRGPQDAPDFITIDSADGGTGAAPQSLMDYVGQPIRRSLPLVVDTLTAYGLRQRIKIIASGKLINPADVAWALCMGADFVVSARAFMFALGCIQALQCNRNTCPTGITTHNPDLQRGLDPINKAERVCNLAKNISYEVCVLAHSCGVGHPRALQRHHALLINEVGIPEPVDQVFPPPVAAETMIVTDRPGAAA
ncbi:MAG: FMN-binding glutamate synthase family protein [Pseudomonadales bacterium]